MKILIAYATKSGTTGRCAEKLGEMLKPHEITVCDLEKQNPDIEKFDFIAVGSPIRRGKLHKKVAAFIEKNKARLLEKRAGYFICCGYTDSADEYIVKNIDSALLDKSVCYSCFGGELNVKACKGFDRFVTRMIISSMYDGESLDGEMSNVSLPSINPDSIGRFAEKVRMSFRV